MKKLFFLLILATSLSNAQLLIDRKYYVTSYDCEHRVPQWSAYILDSNKLIQNTKRYPKFFTDPTLNCEQQTNKDYSKSGYDKGHLAPAADFLYLPKSEKSVFYLTNIAPQFASFNRGQWKSLETYTRKLAMEYDSLLVITGVSFNSYQQYIGNEVFIPDYFFKIIYVYKTKETYCYKIANAECSKNFQEFKIPLDSLKRHVENLPDSLNFIGKKQYNIRKDD